MPEGARVAARETVGTTEKVRSAEPSSHGHRRPPTLHAQLLHCQKTVGNRAVQRLIPAGLGQAAAKNKPLTQRQVAQALEIPRPADRSQAAEPAPVAQPSPAAPISAVPRPTHNAPHIQKAWYNFDIPFTDYQFDPSLEGIKTAANVVKDTAVEGFEWIVDQIKGLVSSGIEWLTDKWDSLKEFATSAFDAAKSSFTNILGFIKSPLGFLMNGLMNLDAQSLARAWAAFSGLVSTIANGFKAMTGNLLGQVNKVWSGINGFATSLLSRVSSLTENFVFKKLPDALQRIAFGVIDRLKALWKSINDGWNKIFAKIKAWVDSALDTVFNFVRRVMSFGINVVISGIIQFGKIVLFLKDLFTNPKKYVDLLAKRSVAAFDGVAGWFGAIVNQHFGGGKTEAAPAGHAAGNPAGNTKVQRSPGPAAPAETKKSASWADIGHGVAGMMGKKWDQFKSNPMAVVMGLLMDLVFPMVGNIKDVIQLFKDIKKVATGPLSAGSLEELWTSLLLILDIPIMIYHTVVSILMRTLMVPLIVATFIPEPTVKSIAAAVGYALLGAFVQVEMMNLGQKLLLLKTGLTDKEQKQEAYNRIADSLIALAMAAAIVLIMLLLHFIVNLAKGVYSFIKGKVIGIEPTPVEAKGPAPAEGKGGAPEEGKGPAPEDKVPDAPAEAPEMFEGEKVVGKRATADGHEVKVTEKGRCLLCTTCKDLEIEFQEELKLETEEVKAIKEDLEVAKGTQDGSAAAEQVERLKARLEEVRKAQARSADPGAPKSPVETKTQGLIDQDTKLEGALRDLKDTKLRSEEVGELRTDPEVKKELAKLEGEVDQLQRDRARLREELDSTHEVAKDPEMAELADAEAERLAKELEALEGKTKEINDKIDERLRQQKEAKAQKAAARQAAEESADTALETANDICDNSEGIGRKTASVGDKTTESAIREEIDTGKPVKGATHATKATQDIRALERLRGQLEAAKPLVEDQPRLKAIDETVQRINERIDTLKEALAEWEKRAETHPDIFNPDGSSKKQPGWPEPPPD